MSAPILGPGGPNLHLGRLLDSAVRLHQAGQIDRAEDAYRRILSVVPRHPGANHLLGLIARHKGQHDEAVRLISEAVKQDPTNAIYHSNLGVTYEDMKRHVDAVRCYRHALAIDSDIAPLHNNLGVALQAMGKHEQAIDAFNKALSLEPRYAEAHNNLGISLLALADAWDPGHDASSEGWEQGEVREDQEQFLAKKVERHAREALRLNPGYAGAWLTLGRALAEIGRYGEAIEAYRSAIALQPDNPDLLQYFAHGLSQIGETKAAAEALRSARNLSPDQAYVHRLLARMENHSTPDGDTDAIQAAYARSEPKTLARMHLAFGMGKICEDQGAYATAFEYFQEGNAIRRARHDYDIKQDIEGFDLIKRAFTPDLFARLAGAGDPDPTPIFVLGMPRSGTTLTEQILASHPDVHGAGELSYLRHMATVHGLMSGDKYDPERVSGCGPEVLATIGGNYLRLLRGKTGEARFITDKMPYNFLNIGLIRLALPNARIVHCRREPADNCLSIFKSYFSVSGHPYAYDLSELGHYHNLYRDLMAYWHEVMPGVIYDIEYEAMVADQEGQSRALLEFCGLEWNEAVLNFHETIRNVKTASMDQVYQPIYDTSVGLSKRYGVALRALQDALEEKDGRTH